MSHVIKVNLSLWLSILAFGGVIFAGVSAINKRDHDVSSLRTGLDALTSEVKGIKVDSKIDRETLIEIRSELKWLSSRRAGDASTASSGGK